MSLLAVSMVSQAGGLWEVLNTVQLVAAGMGAGAVLLLAVAAKATRELRVVGWLAVTAAVLASLLVVNWGILVAARTNTVEALLFGRALVLSALPLVVILASSAIARRPWWPVLLGTVIVVAVLRVGLWIPTDLLYRHELVDGVPQYGPLIPVTGPIAILAVLVHLIMIDRDARFELGRLAYDVGIAGMLVVAAATLIVDDPIGAEVLTGFMAIPLLVAVYALAANRISGLRQLDVANDQLRAALDEHGTRDSLTGLPNRHRLVDLVDEVRWALDDADVGIAVLLIDIDAFKSFNDAHGSQRGDEVLREVGRRIEELCPQSSRVCRFGGDEFAIACPVPPGTSAAVGARQMATRALTSLSQPYVGADYSARLTASIGIALGDRSSPAGDLIRDAGIALHRTRDVGAEGRVEVFDPGLRAKLLEEVGIRDALRGAVDRGEIEVCYQPVIDLITGRLIGAEALARWRYGGVVRTPRSWIPVAEQSPLINTIGAAVLRTATADALRWCDVDPNFTMAVNVSPNQLLGDGGIQVVADVLACGLPPDRLVVEVVENAVVSDHALRALHALKSLGVRIALDDFGIGYSSLGAIDRLPIDILKIDQTFIMGLDRPDSEAVVRAVYALASSLELDVVAEGIETEEQHRRVVAMGGRRGQGFLFSKPVDAPTFDGLVRAMHSTGQPPAGRPQVSQRVTSTYPMDP